MKSAPDPPPAPDPAVTAGAQSHSNIETAIANARLNRVNQQTPWGSINYTQGPVDANGVPTYSSQITLDPAQQALLNQQRAQQTQRGNISSNLLNQVGGQLSQPLDLSDLHSMYDRYGSQQEYAGAPRAAPSQQPAQQAPQQAQQMPGREQMLQMLMQFLQGQGQSPIASSGNPMARALTSGGSAPVTSPTTGANPQIPGALPASLVNQIHDNPGQDWSKYAGSLGNVSDPNGQNLGAEDGSNANRYAPLDPRVWDVANRTLRPEIAAKFMRNGVQYEPWNQTHGVLDQGKVVFDPELGLITPKGNNRNPPSGGFSDVLPWAMAALPALAIAGGVGAGVEGAGELGAGSAAVDPYAIDVTANAALPGADATTAAAGGAPVTDLSTQATQPSMGSRLLNNWSSGRGLLGMGRAGGAIPLLAQLLRGNSQGGR